MKRPVVYFTLGDNSPTTVFQSKVGGKPYLPIGAEYPKNRKTGNPLTLLAQINFTEMPSMPDFPTQGILQFFVDMSDDNYGSGTDEYIPSEWRAPYRYSYEELYEKLFSKRIGYDVIYHKEILPENQLQTDFSAYPIIEYQPELQKEYGLIHNEFPISFKEIDEEEIDANNTTKFEPVHKINGNARFVQGDAFHWVFYTYDSEYWYWYKKHILLFQLGSEYSQEHRAYKTLWGDCGVGNFFITPEDLKNLDFSKVVYCWAGG